MAAALVDEGQAALADGEQATVAITLAGEEHAGNNGDSTSW